MSTTEDHNSNSSVNIDKVEDTEGEGGKYFALISAMRGLQTGDLYEDSRFELLSQISIIKTVDKGQGWINLRK